MPPRKWNNGRMLLHGDRDASLTRSASFFDIIRNAFPVNRRAARHAAEQRRNRPCGPVTTTRIERNWQAPNAAMQTTEAARKTQ